MYRMITGLLVAMALSGCCGMKRGTCPYAKHTYPQASAGCNCCAVDACSGPNKITY